MSSIFLKDGIYWYQRYVKNPMSGRNDKRIQRSLRTKNRIEAEVRQQNLDKGYDDNENHNRAFPPRLLSTCINEYLSEKKKQVDDFKRSLNTYRSDDITLNQFLAFMKDVYDDKNIREINSSHIKQFKEYREADPAVNSSSTVSLNLRVTRAFFSRCMEKEYIEDHPFKHIKIKKSLRRETIPKGDDFENLVKIFRKIVQKPYPKHGSNGKNKMKEPRRWIFTHDWFPYAIWIILNTGMRIGEVLMLKWERGDNDFINKGRTYSYSYLSKDFSLISIYFKRGNRELPVKPLRPIFNKIPKTYTTKLDGKEVSRKKIYVFENERTHEPYLTTSAANLWKQFVIDFKLDENWTIHSLRHAVSTALLGRGETLFAVGKVLGHSVGEMTQLYSHSTVNSLEKTMAVLHQPKRKSKTKRPKATKSKHTKN